MTKYHTLSGLNKQTKNYLSSGVWSVRLRCWQYWFCYQSGQVVPCQGPRLGQNTLSWPGSFSFSTRFAQPIRKLMPRPGEHKLYSVTKNRDPSSLQINFSTQLRWRHQIQRRVEVKERNGKGRRNFHDNSDLVWTWDARQLSFSVLVWAFPLVVMATINCQALVGVSFSMLR